MTVALAPVDGERVLANATIVVGERMTAVIDAMFSPAMVAPVREEAERLGGRRVGIVVLTHADPDHVLGLPAFPGAVVVATRRAADVLADPTVRRAYAELHDRFGGTSGAFAPPAVDVAFGDVGRIDLGGLHLEAALVGPAHSPADTLLWCPQERVAWSGDLVFNGVFPLVREGVERWLAGLDRLQGWAPTAVVPGHGMVAGAAIIEDQRRLLQALHDEIPALHAARVPVDVAAAGVRFEAYRRVPLAGERIAGAVRGTYGALDRFGR